MSQPVSEGLEKLMILCRMSVWKAANRGLNAPFYFFECLKKLCKAVPLTTRFNMAPFQRIKASSDIGVT